MKKIIALVLTVLLASSAAAYGAGYTDVTQGNWAYDAINAMSDRMIINGYLDGSFKPDNTITYGEFIKMALIAATGEDAGNAAVGNWASNYYDKALELGCFTEYDIEKSRLNDKITRAHMALIISAILGNIEIDNYDKIQEGITDITYQTKYEYDITKAYTSGILTGYTDKTFHPERTLSRAEASIVIYRLVDETKRIFPGGEETALTGKVEDIVKNYNSFINSGDGTINEDLAASETYTIETDASKYNMSLHENRGTTWIEIGNANSLHQMYLMKDGNIIESMQSAWGEGGSRSSAYKSDITKIDYIVSLYVSQKSMILIVNPFKVQL